MSALVTKTPIRERLTQPTPEQVKAARKAAGLNQTEAALLVSTAQSRPERTWQDYEVAIGKPQAREIPLAVWELFLLLTCQHPTLTLVPRE